MKYTIDTDEKVITLHHHSDDMTLEDLWKEFSGYEDFRIVFAPKNKLIDQISHQSVTNSPPIFHYHPNPYTISYAGDTKNQLIVETDKTEENAD